MDNGKCREIYVRDASAIAKVSGATPRAIKARVMRLAHELADGEAVTSWHHLDAVAAIAACVMGLGGSDPAHHARAERECRALAVTERAIAAPYVARTTRETPPAYVAPPVPAKVAVSNVVALFGRAMRGAA